ncbi:DNA-directed RNA polymerase sigma-70 factor [Parapedobacter defluvii]|uniref:DNA-directed RNA polymerase sigma-70 factor n=1 Tax=Parapedobacter defluvii TaxID=2045106 RepID=A0ABQ1L5U3_9SPHI|nr:sigma-70 family RNA polymerase sigma factor [Parapedobacter defluvii]GGC17975.1 DNA-directed RNA polymerase sigma-70 factor [Parapedobacter defluvii]
MVDYARYDDTQLVALLRERDKLAYTEIYTRFWPILFRHALRLLRDEDEATDVVQDIFAVLWEKATALKLSGTLAGYLYSATRNRVIDRIARHKTEQYYLNSLEDYLKQGTPAADDALIAAELAQQIEREVAKLPKKMRQIFAMRQQAQHSYREIAESLGTTEGNVKKQLYNAMKLLKSKFHIWFLAGIWHLLSFWFRHFN